MRDRLELPRTFRANIVFAFNIDLFDPKWRIGETGAIFVDTVAITATGARSLRGFSPSSLPKPERAHCANSRKICRGRLRKARCAAKTGRIEWRSY
jgi:hypothetical protein